MTALPEPHFGHVFRRPVVDPPSRVDVVWEAAGEVRKERLFIPLPLLGSSRPSSLDFFRLADHAWHERSDTVTYLLRDLDAQNLGRAHLSPPAPRFMERATLSLSIMASRFPLSRRRAAPPTAIQANSSRETD